MTTDKTPPSTISHIPFIFSLILSITTISVGVYLTVRLLENEHVIASNSEKIRVLEDFITRRSKISSIEKSEGGERVKRSSNSITLSLDELLKLRGPPGQNGRDGKDGKDGESCECSFNRVIQNQTDILLAVQNMLSQHVSGQQEMISSGGAAGSNVGGSTYTRWGRVTCGNDSSLIYDGFVTGSYYNSYGGSSDLQCLPRRPEFDLTITASKYYTYLYGAEYESYGPIPSAAYNQNLPCARCYSRRSATIMMPAKRKCPDSWTMEYEGFLMTGNAGHKNQIQTVCVDRSPEYLTGLSPDVNGVLLYFVRTSCPNIGHCPPYTQADLSCVVCTK